MACLQALSFLIANLPSSCIAKPQLKDIQRWNYRNLGRKGGDTHVWNRGWDFSLLFATFLALKFMACVELGGCALNFDKESIE